MEGVDRPLLLRRVSVAGKADARSPIVQDAYPVKLSDVRNYWAIASRERLGATEYRQHDARAFVAPTCRRCRAYSEGSS
jgi:hypothetical protein